MRHSFPFFWGIVVLLATLGAVPAPLQAGPATAGVRNAEILVRLKPSVDPLAFSAKTGLRLEAGANNQIAGLPIYRFTILDNSSPSAKAAAFASNPNVIYAEPNYVGQSPEATRRSSWVVGFSAGDYANQWAPARINLPAAHALSQGAGVIVAILDTAIDSAHSALSGRLLPGYDFIGDEDDSAASSEQDLTGDHHARGHGTHVAGLVALTAPAAQILPLRTLDDDGTGDLWTQIEALRYAFERGAGVANLSFSFGERSQLFDDVVAEVSCSSVGSRLCRGQRRPGLVVVAAAGNTGTRAREWPGASAVPGIVGVGASTEQDGLASFSTYGGQIAVAAPGENIISSIPGDQYAIWSGTSMATPFVSGVAALVRAKYPQSQSLDVLMRITASTDTINAPVHGRLNALAALTIER